MDNNFDEKALQQAKSMANSPAGKELLQLMNGMDPEALKKIMQQASAGDFSQMASSLSPFLNSQKVQELLRQMGGK